jgi:hypothetical protein
MENCTFGEYPAVLTKLKLLANTSIYWSKSRLASGSEQICGSAITQLTILIDYGTEWPSLLGMLTVANIYGSSLS